MHASDTNPDSAKRQADKVHYADGAAALLGEQVGQFAHPQAPDWEQVKQNASRTVYRGRVGDQDIYLKHFHSRTLPHRLGRLLGCSDALAEMRYSQHLLARGVPAVQALAATCDADVEWLATRAVAPADPGDEWHDRQLARGEEGFRAIRAATLALADLIGRMHAAGVVHHDLHCGNVLVRTDADPVELVLTDLHRASLRRRLSRRARAANVAMLLHDRRHVTTRTDRLRFLRRYLQTSGATGTLRGWELQIDDFARRHTRRLNRQRDRRVVGTNRYFARIRLPGGWRGHVVQASKRRLADSRAATLEFDAAAWREALKDPASLLTGEGCTVLKDSESSLVVRRSLTVGEHTLDIVVKRARRKHGWKVLIDCFRTSRAIRAFRMGHALLSRRIANVLPLAAVERRTGPLLTDSILITEAVDDPKLNDFFNHWLSSPPASAGAMTPAQQRRLGRDVLWQMGRLVQRLHDHRFAHRDLKANNVLVHGSPGRPPELVLVDLDGLWPVRVLTARRRFQGLMRLNVSLLQCPTITHAGRLRVLLGYLRRPGCGRVNFKTYWRVLAEWSGRKLRRQIRSGSAAGLEAPRRVLILKPSSLGDVVTAVPILRGLRRAFPDAHLSWLLSTSCVPLMEGDADLDEIIPFDRRGMGAWWYWLPATKKLLALRRTLRRGRFDWTIDLQGLLRSGLFTRMTRATVRAGFANAREGATCFYNRRIDVAATHTIERNVELIRALGVEASVEDMTLAPTGEGRTFAEQLCDELGCAAGEYVVCVPPTRWPTKRYPVRHWRRVVAALAADRPVVLLGAPGDEAYCEAACEGIDRTVSLAGRTNVPQMVGVIAASAGVICSDSAAMFIAPAVGVGVIVLVGPTRVDRTGPLGSGRAIVADVPCQGCLRKQCRHITCMEMIDPAAVVAAADELFAPGSS